MSDIKHEAVKFPDRLLNPIRRFLEKELKQLLKIRKSLNAGDPFKDGDRTTNNSLEEDVDEQVGHFDNQAKVKFLSRQIVQMRKALTTIKLGTYGTCESCGRMIDTDRLAVRPDTTFCIQCEKERES